MQNSAVNLSEIKGFRMDTKLENINFLAFWGRAIGIIFAIIGFYFWYNKVQKLLDKKLLSELKCKS
jgi:hypothetical protein